MFQIYLEKVVTVSLTDYVCALLQNDAYTYKPESPCCIIVYMSI
jgi:hypothetical protein